MLAHLLLLNLTIAPLWPGTLYGHTAQTHTYRYCRVNFGMVSYCGRWFTGKTVLWDRNAYRACHIFNGRLSYCGTWFTGETVIWVNNAYRTCRIFNGRLSYCRQRFSGEAILSEGQFQPPP
ncbi:hypothetical protein L5220_10600 [Synechococcus sp. PCC 6716]|nr:hypothetical protein [Synechococcus sp. PCC 6716]